MVDLVKLNQKIDSTGLKKGFIAKKMGYSQSALSLKCSGKRRISANDIVSFRRVLKLSEKETKDIFLS